MNTSLAPALPVTLETLAARPLWVAWRAEEREPGKPVTKVPYSPRGGRARADDPATWGTRDGAEDRARLLPRKFGAGGVGLELADLGDGYHLGGIDLDSCRNESGALTPWAVEVVDRLATYAEVSPSGTGVKAFFKYLTADLPEHRAAMGTDHGKSWKAGTGPHPPAIELHLGNRYFAVTGEHLAGTPAELATIPAEAIRWLIREAGPSFAAGGAASPTKPAKGAESAGDIAARIEEAAALWPSLARRWGGDWDGLQDQSRSARAFALGAALKAAGFDRTDIEAALKAHPDTCEWASEATPRDFVRIAERAASETKPQPWAAPAMSIALQDTAPPPALDLASVFSPEWVGWIEAAAEAKGAPPDYVAGALLSIAGALIGNARSGSPWDSWKEPPVMNVALVGLPSAGKSPALDAVAVPLGELEASINDDWPQRRREYATAKAEAKLKREAWEAEVKQAVKDGLTPPMMPASAEEPPPIGRRRIYSTDPTVAKAERMSAANPRGLILQRDELSGWIAGMDRFNSGAGSDRAFWLQANGGRPWTPDRVKDGDAEIAVPHLTWSIVGTIQPDRLATLLLAGDDDGMAARFLYIWPGPRRPSRPRAGLRTGGLAERLGRLHTLHWTAPEPLAVAFDAKAQDNMQAWREAVAEMEAGAAGLFLSWLGKLPGFGLRLATILAHLDWCEHGRGEPPAVITGDAMARACDFLENYAVPMARRCFGEAALPEAERDSRRLARWLRQRTERPTVLNVQELRRMAGGPGIPTAERLRAALAELAGLSIVREATPNRAGAGGRSRNDWDVNPGFWETGNGVA